MSYVEEQMDQAPRPRPSTYSSKPASENPLAVIGGMVVFVLMLAIFFCGGMV